MLRLLIYSEHVNVYINQYREDVSQLMTILTRYLWFPLKCKDTHGSETKSEIYTFFFTSPECCT